MLRYFELSIRILALLTVGVLVSTLIGTLAFYGLSSMKNSLDEVTNVRVPSIESLHAISRAMLAVDGAENALLATDLTEQQQRSIHAQFHAAKTNLDEGRRAYEELPQSPEEARLWREFISALEKWWQDHEAFVRTAREYEQGKNPSAYRAMSLQASVVNVGSLSAAEALLGQIIKLNQKIIERENNDAGIMTTSLQIYIVGTALAGTGLSVAIGLILCINLVRRSRRYGPPLILDVKQPLFSFAPPQSACEARLPHPHA